MLGASIVGVVENPGSLANPNQVEIIGSVGKGAFTGIVGGAIRVTF